jgi:hypothetical protein
LTEKRRKLLKKELQDLYLIFRFLTHVANFGGRGTRGRTKYAGYFEIGELIQRGEFKKLLYDYFHS